MAGDIAQFPDVCRWLKEAADEYKHFLATKHELERDLAKVNKYLSDLDQKIQRLRKQVTDTVECHALV